MSWFTISHSTYKSSMFFSFRSVQLRTRCNGISRLSICVITASRRCSIAARVNRAQADSRTNCIRFIIKPTAKRNNFERSLSVDTFRTCSLALRRDYDDKMARFWWSWYANWHDVDQIFQLCCSKNLNIIAHIEVSVSNLSKWPPIFRFSGTKFPRLGRHPTIYIQAMMLAIWSILS